MNPRELVPDDEPIVFVIGAMAHGSVSKKNILFSFMLECVV